MQLLSKTSSFTSPSLFQIYGLLVYCGGLILYLNLSIKYYRYSTRKYDTQQCTAEEHKTEFGRDSSYNTKEKHGGTEMCFVYLMQTCTAKLHIWLLWHITLV